MSHEVALWFHVESVCRYRLPVVVQTDKGSEYKGEFDMYMRRNGVEHRFTATMNPRANGLVERVNRVTKSSLRRSGRQVVESARRHGKKFKGPADESFGLCPIHPCIQSPSTTRNTQ